MTIEERLTKMPASIPSSSSTSSSRGTPASSAAGSNAAPLINGFPHEFQISNTNSPPDDDNEPPNWGYAWDRYAHRHYHWQSFWAHHWYVGPGLVAAGSLFYMSGGRNPGLRVNVPFGVTTFAALLFPFRIYAQYCEDQLQLLGATPNISRTVVKLSKEAETATTTSSSPEVLFDTAASENAHADPTDTSADKIDEVDAAPSRNFVDHFGPQLDFWVDHWYVGPVIMAARLPSLVLKMTVPGLQLVQPPSKWGSRPPPAHAGPVTATAWAGLGWPNGFKLAAFCGLTSAAFFAGSCMLKRKLRSTRQERSSQPKNTARSEDASESVIDRDVNSPITAKSAARSWHRYWATSWWTGPILVYCARVGFEGIFRPTDFHLIFVPSLVSVPAFFMYGIYCRAVEKERVEREDREQMLMQLCLAGYESKNGSDSSGGICLAE